METDQTLYQIFKSSKGVSTDTREDLEGKIFFALSGENFDGNKFAKNALAKGALLAVVDNSKYAVDESYLLVEDSLLALQRLAKKYVSDLDIPVFAITGSNGKTTTKELINAVLRKELKIHATKGNFNNHIGVPLTILSCPQDAEFLLVEMGANHLKEIALLCEIACPKYGAITNIGKAHLEGFGSLENIAKAKTELYEYLAKKQGTIVLNVNDPVLKNYIPNDTNVFPFNDEIKSESGLTYMITRTNNHPYITLEIANGETKTEIASNLIGDFNFLNIQLAIAVGILFNIPTESIKNGIEAYIPQNNRTEIRNIGSNTIVLDAYNANPSSMRESIKSFSLMGERRILILGDMKELGDHSLNEHEVLLDFLSDYEWEEVYLVGEEFYACKNDRFAKRFLTAKDLINAFSFDTYNSTHFLLKGSRSMKLESLLKE